MSIMEIEEIVTILREKLSHKQVTTNETIRSQHGKDESYHQEHLPDIVVFPHTTNQASEVIAVAHGEQIPVAPFGLGSRLEGDVIPYEGGSSIDFSEMNHILEIRDKDLLVRVQPGMTRTQVNDRLTRYGLFFSVDPGADATIGGMAATNASGTTSVKYGIMRDQV